VRTAAAAAAFALLLAGAARADDLALTGSFTQGGLVHGRAAPQAIVSLDGRLVHVAPDGGFILGFGRDAAPSAALTVLWPQGLGEERTLEIAPRRYDVQRVDGLPPKTVTPDAETLARIRRDGETVRAVRQLDSDEPFFAGRLIWPAHGPISGVWGSQRVLNGEPRQPHFGVDIAAPAGTPVVAAAGGEVTMAQNLVLTGNTAIIDHGHGLSTTYAHMATLEVARGQRVEQGQRIGTVGATGRATGPHLHWSLEWFGVRLDPMLAAGPMPQQTADDKAAR
jgi:murein DD-endopeptidase MepM/ murein hydrolase activator NlpD